jgi:hypothetical protein
VSSRSSAIVTITFNSVNQSPSQFKGASQHSSNSHFKSGKLAVAIFITLFRFTHIYIIAPMLKEDRAVTDLLRNTIVFVDIWGKGG